MGELVQPNTNPIFGRFVREYTEKAGRSFVMLNAHYIPEQARFRIKVTYDARQGTNQFIYWSQLDIDEMNLHRITEPELLGEVDEFVMKFVKAIPEDITGKYPHIRLWADMHLGNSKLFGHPEREIPGWMFGRFQSSTGTRYEGLRPLANVQVDGTSVGDYNRPDPKPMDVPESLKPNRLPHINSDEAEELIVATKKKVVKTQPPKIDPSKVKKPLCPTHRDPMEFDPVKYKWKCKAPGCKIVSRPARDEDDKSVQIGRGETSLRIVATEDEFAVLLVSDDNIALDITKLLPNVKVFLDSIGAIDLARDADENGQLTVSDRTPRPIHFEARFGVIGTEDLIAKYDLNDF